MSTETNIHRESRLVKLKKLQELGYNPYPYKFKPNAYAADLQEKYKDLEAGVDTEDRVIVAGRAMAVRNNGMFIDIKDNSGKIQAFCHKNHLPEDQLELLKNLVLPFALLKTAIILHAFVNSVQIFLHANLKIDILNVNLPLFHFYRYLFQKEEHFYIFPILLYLLLQSQFLLLKF